MTTVLIDAPHFCAALVAHNGLVVKAAPIIKYMVGWDASRVRDYCRSKGWSWRS